MGLHFIRRARRGVWRSVFALMSAATAALVVGALLHQGSVSVWKRTHRVTSSHPSLAYWQYRQLQPLLVSFIAPLSHVGVGAWTPRTCCGLSAPPAPLPPPPPASPLVMLMCACCPFQSYLLLYQRSLPQSGAVECSGLWRRSYTPHTAHCVSRRAPAYAAGGFGSHALPVPLSLSRRPSLPTLIKHLHLTD
jgi:hypothetical protein